MITFPNTIELQLHNYCNADCIICPYSEIKNQKGFLNEDLFEKILSEVGDKDILFIPYLNNEPFIDPDYCRKLKMINERCPNCRIEISSNISCITEEIINELLNIDIYDFRISFFGFSPDTYEKIMPGLKYESSWSKLNMILDSELPGHVAHMSITMIDHENVPSDEFEQMRHFCNEKGVKFNHWGFLDRASNNSRYKNAIPETKTVCGCEQNRPIERLHVLFNGDVILCCQDWRSEIVLGNLNDNSISELWNGEKYTDVRNRIYKNCNGGVDLCNKCKLAIRR